MAKTSTAGSGVAGGGWEPLGLSWLACWVVSCGRATVELAGVVGDMGESPWYREISPPGSHVAPHNHCDFFFWPESYINVGLPLHYAILFCRFSLCFVELERIDPGAGGQSRGTRAGGIE